MKFSTPLSNSPVLASNVFSVPGPEKSGSELAELLTNGAELVAGANELLTIDELDSMVTELTAVAELITGASELLDNSAVSLDAVSTGAAVHADNTIVESKAAT